MLNNQTIMVKKNTVQFEFFNGIGTFIEILDMNTL